MFEDLGEQEYVFSLLDEWANSDHDLNLNYLTGRESKIGDLLTSIIKEVQSKEEDTIKKNPKLKVGFSHQSELLGTLWLLLAYANTAAKLLAKLPEIKIALLQAMVIWHDIKHDRLTLISGVGAKVIAGGKKGHAKTYGTDQDKTERRNKWQAWVNETIQQHPSYSFEAVKKIVVKKHPGEVSVSQLKRYTKDTRKT